MERPSLSASDGFAGRSLAVAGSVILESPHLQERLLATAYDTNWRLRVMVTTDCLPAMASSSGSWFNAGRRTKSTRSSPKSVASPKGFPSSAAKEQASATVATRPANTSASSASQKRQLGITKSASQPNLSAPGPSEFVRQESEQSMSSSRMPSHMSVRKGSHASVRRQSIDELMASELARPVSSLQVPDSEAQEEKPPVVRREIPLQQHADEAGVPIDIARAAIYCFMQFVTSPPLPEYRKNRESIIMGKPFDAVTDLGSMNRDGFSKSLCQIAECKDLDLLPEGFLESAMLTADKNDNGEIDFNEFLYFFYKFSFAEEVLVAPAEREMRYAARENGIEYEEIGMYKRAFDQADTNHNNTIEYTEFVGLITKLLKVPKGHNLQEKRSKEMWREALRTSKEKNTLDFFGFVAWYKRYFVNNDEGSGESPFEAFYHNIRRVPGAPGVGE